MTSSHVVISCLILSIFLLGLYIGKINRLLLSQPPTALALSPHRWTDSEIKSAYKKHSESPISMAPHLPPRTGNRYIVVGGSGFLGGWIIIHLLQRGEDPTHIRILDLRPPTRMDMSTGDAARVAFFQVDITNNDQLSDAFNAPWPDAVTTNSQLPPLVIFHTAANIRFYERAKFLVPRSSRVNIEGTRNLLNNAQRVGAACLIYTSSGSVAVKEAKHWILPWHSVPENFVQVIDDDESRSPKDHQDFFSNYAFTKRQAEILVRGYNRCATPQGTPLFTGCLRPANGVYGPGGDILVGAYLVRRVNPTWIQNSIQSEVYVENVSLAHLLYERRLLDMASPGLNSPDIGGQAFLITDPNPPITYGDIYHALEVLTDGETVFPKFPPAVMLIFAHLVELYYLFWNASVSIPLVGSLISSILPPIGGDIVNLQPSLFRLTSVHLLFDDSRAQLSPSKGGLGYKPPFTSLDGVCKLVYEFKASGGKGEERQQNGGGVSFGFGLTKAERGTERVAEKLGVVKHKD